MTQSLSPVITMMMDYFHILNTNLLEMESLSLENMKKVIKKKKHLN